MSTSYVIHPSRRRLEVTGRCQTFSLFPLSAEAEAYQYFGFADLGDEHIYDCR